MPLSSMADCDKREDDTYHLRGGRVMAHMTAELAVMERQEVDGAGASVSAEVPDWSRERPRRFWDPGRKLLLALRTYQYWRDRGGPLAPLFCTLAVLRHRIWSVVTGAEIPLNCRIGGGLLVPHPNGIVIHPEARIGVNCLIFQQVTLGTRGRSGAPQIAGHVDIGAGAKILGPVRIGAHALIGASAVVIEDVPDGSIAIGIPARLIE